MFQEFPKALIRQPTHLRRLTISLQHFEPGARDINPLTGEKIEPTQSITYRAELIDDITGRVAPTETAAGDLSPHLTPAERAQLLAVLEAVLARAQKLLEAETK